MIENFLIHETVLVFLIELLAHSHSLTYFQVLLVSARSDTPEKNIFEMYLILDLI